MVVDFEQVLMPGETFLQKYDDSKEFSNYMGIHHYREYFKEELKVNQHWKEIMQKLSKKYQHQCSNAHPLLEVDISEVNLS